MEGYIVLGLLSFLAGFLVGKHIGDLMGKHRFLFYMQNVSAVHNTMRRIHEAHGITAEVNAALKADGYEVEKVSRSEVR